MGIQTNGAKGAKKSLGTPLMRAFYEDHADELLPVALMQGVDQFAKAFCEVYSAQPGQETGVMVTPLEVAPVFKDFFTDHLRFFEIVKSAHAAIGDGFEEKDLESFYELIKESPEFESVKNSTTLTNQERRIICSMMLPNTVEMSEENTDFVTTMFPEDAPVNPENELPDPEEAAITDVSKHHEFQIAPTDQRKKAIEVIQEFVFTFDSEPFPTNAQTRDQITKKHPDLEDWLALVETRDWVSRKLSYYINKRREHLVLPKPSVKTKIEKAIAKSRATSTERAKALVIIRAEQGKIRYHKPKFYKTKEMVEIIATKLPELADWLNSNKKWVGETLGGIKYSMAKGKKSSRKAEAVQTAELAETVSPVIEESATEYESAPTESVRANDSDFLGQMETLVNDMKGGEIGPKEIIRRGKALQPEIDNFREEIKKFETLENEYNDRLSKYEDTLQ